MSNQPTFFFYDLETSGIDARKQRIMQFAGQRTDMDLKPIGEPIDIKIALSDDVLPDPYAVLITGLTPQQSVEEGYSEAEFLKIFYKEVVRPNTTIVGFNSVRFDDEFMRFTLWRNFYDAYEWQWKDDSSRWDILDIVRMTRALRPEGMTWPYDIDGAPTNRLELLTKVNKLEHTNAHDALSDVQATIDVARLIKAKQPKLFDYLYGMRNKRSVEKLVSEGQPFLYTSGSYPKEVLHTTAVVSLGQGSRAGTAVVYDLRHDPATYEGKSVDELKKMRFATREMRKQEGFIPLPAKEMAFNKCPAIALIGAIGDVEVQKRLDLSVATIEKHRALLHQSGLKDKLMQVFESSQMPKAKDVDAALYDGFIGDGDKTKMRAVRSANALGLADFHPDFADERLNKLLLRYKARNYPQSLSEDERTEWEAYRTARLQTDAPVFAKQLQSAGVRATSERDQFLLQELQLWFENVMPVPE